ncbi:choice-of-anchor B family protein [Psychroflexus sediminis]|uniref:Choice-of-anchor B domain-containing protein n=1 Tax=Psychroflexus sediminis TaxID=470826 RepID=A0A1G7TYW2_9FLAO|nr:choice-of-anchor B family protein [Psychroflexus sediminis]SDG40427.1 choice-of-anchor B domain-containing protein [Psychroflexus sediminis]
MKKLYFSTLGLFLSITVCSQTPCENGLAGAYPCDGYDLMSQISLEALSATAGNDSWGWTDPQDGKEYALMGLNNGTAFIDVSDPTAPVYLGKLPTHTQSSPWRDMKVYDNYAFIVSEAPNHGMQVFDLRRLRNSTNTPVTFNSDAHYDGFGNAHNIVISTGKAYAYVVGTSTYEGGPHIIDISNPLNPVLAGGYAGSLYTHDAQVVTYNGPDTDYTGKEIFLGCNEEEAVIVDVTVPGSPVLISTMTYSDIGYPHQGWLTENQRYFFLGDELDERDFALNTRTLVFDLQDLNNPVQHQEYFGPTSAIDHNGYLNNNLFYLSNYTAGIKIIDVTNVASQSLSEIGFFDTHPENNSTSFSGSWSNYPFFESGNILVSDIERGFFLIRKSGTLSASDFTQEDFSIFPNPASSYVQIKNSSRSIQSVELYTLLGQKVYSKKFKDKRDLTINVESFKAGLYMLRINNSFTRKLIIN